MSARARYLVPVQPANGHGETVVIHVQQQGSHPLDLELVGCEGERPYVTSRKTAYISWLQFGT